MPEVRPADLADAIRSLRPNISIVFMSGFVDKEVIRIRIQEDCGIFLPKPFKADGLLHAVAQAMEQPASDHSRIAGILLARKHGEASSCMAASSGLLV
jgi:FixJ family two-component response regulator